MRRSPLLVSLLLMFPVAACSDSDDDVAASPTAVASESTEPSPSPSPSASAAASPNRSGPWVTQVNKLCDELIDPVVAVRGGEGLEPTRESYLAQKPEIDELLEEFNAEVDAIPVPEDEQEAAATFKAFREFADADDEHLKEAADSGDEATFQEQFAAAEEPFRIQRTKLAAVGITCPAY